MCAAPAAPPPISARELAKRQILCNPTAKYSVRMVTHYDVDRAGIDRALAAMSEVCAA